MINPKKNQISTVESPCVRNCCLNAEDICLGCFRHINEITGWQGFSQNEKVAILAVCDKRRNEQKPC
ncbi:DUF1289 domain-containing protein [Colwelliaceae bacterium 6441]